MRYLLEVTSRATPGRTADYDDWYDTIHMHDVLAVPGVHACTRYVRADPGSAGEPKFVALYEVETDDPWPLLRTLGDRAGTMRMSDAIDLNSVRLNFLKPVGTGRRTAG